MINLNKFLLLSFVLLLVFVTPASAATTYDTLVLLQAGNPTPSLGTLGWILDGDGTTTPGATCLGTGAGNHLCAWDGANWVFVQEGAPTTPPGADPEIFMQAVQVAFANAASGMAAVTVQAALDELKETGGGGLATVAISSLPGAPTAVFSYLVSDAVDENDCTVGSGTADLICIWNGSAWVASGGFIPNANPATDHASFDTDTDARIALHTGAVDPHHDESPGAPGQCLFNLGGVVSGDPGCTYNPTTNELSVGSVNLPDVEGKNAHVLRGNEATDYKCATDGAMSDGDLALVSRLGDNKVYLCDENAVAETDFREFVTYEFPGGISVEIRQKSAGAGDYGFVVTGHAGADDGSEIVVFRDGGLINLCTLGYLGIWQCNQFKNADGSFNVNEAGRMQGSQVSLLDFAANKGAGRIKFSDSAAPDDDYDVEFAQMSNGATGGTIGNGTRLRLAATGPVAIWTNQDEPSANGFEICDDDNSACGVFDPPAAMSQQVYDLPDRSGEMGLALKVVVESSATTHVLTASEMYNTTHFCNTASAGGCNYTLPALVVGMRACFGDDGATGNVININPVNGTDVLVQGGGVCAAGVSVDSSGIQGNYACVTAISATRAFLSETHGAWGCGS